MIKLQYYKKENKLEEITSLCDQLGIKTVYQLSQYLQKNGYKYTVSPYRIVGEKVKNDLIEFLRSKIGDVSNYLNK